MLCVLLIHVILVIKYTCVTGPISFFDRELVRLMYAKFDGGWTSHSVLMLTAYYNEVKPRYFLVLPQVCLLELVNFVVLTSKRVFNLQDCDLF